MPGFSQKVIDFVKLLDNLLQNPEDNTQIEEWVDAVYIIADAFEFTDIEENYIDKIIELYEIQFRNLIKNRNTVKLENIPSQLFLDELLNRKQIEQRTPEWYAQMTNILSASELGNLFAAPRTRAKLVLSKTQPYTPRNNPLAVRSDSMSAFDWGIRFEPVVKMIYEYKYKCIIKELGRMYHPIDTRCTASPDGLIYYCPNNERTGRLIEIKCPVTREIDGSIPKDYYAQMQMQMQVTGCKHCDYVEAQFASQYNFNPIKEGPGLYNGLIALIRYNQTNEELNSQEYYYQYGPINDNSWSPIPGEGEEIVEIIPWSLLQWNEQLVIKNEDWWNNIIPIIDEFWNDVEKAKRGEFTVPDSTRPRKQKEEKCIIVFKMEAEK